jgi:uncharacterized protein YggE
MRRLLACVALAVVATTGPAAAQQAAERGITVTGEGHIEARPDMAIINAGVTAQGKTARAASEADNKAMTAVLASLGQGGIAAKDIQTSQFEIHPTYETHGHATRISSFQASNQVSVRLRDVDKVADVLDRVISAGANQISGIQFVVSDRSKRLDQARFRAVQDARRKAEILANAAGVGIGRAIMISEDGAASPRPVMLRAAAMPPPVAVGEQILRVSVSVTFELQH